MWLVLVQQKWVLGVIVQCNAPHVYVMEHVDVVLMSAKSTAVL